jgi:exodeoxyribonuclease-5
MEWSPQQDRALVEVARWLGAGAPPVFRLFGFAGTGKTTLARHIADAVDGEVLFGAYTGKAALVLRAKGCRNAATIHSLIYRARDTDGDNPSFVLNRESAVAKARLVVIDECSMVDEDLGRDLLSFGTPVLVLGDPAQLPPVKGGGGFFTEAEPDVMLTEVHRQAADNPIIRMSMAVRSGESLRHGEYGESRIIRRDEIRAGAVLRADQVLVGTNRTRHATNARIRNLRELGEPLPMVGEKLVCLKNDKTKGLLNGSTWTVQALRGTRKDFVRMTVAPEDESAKKNVKIEVLRQFFEPAGEIPPALRRNSDEFDFGYALTVHKAQGSQWDDVVLFDESYAFRENRGRWLYTGLTRAAERITVIL